MTDQSANAEEERAEEKEPEKSFWATFWTTFTAADLRSFIVTVAGTVVGGILLVMLVAVAVIEARHIDKPAIGGIWGAWTQRLFGVPDIVWVSAVLGLIALVGVLRDLPNLRDPAVRKRASWQAVRGVVRSARIAVIVAMALYVTVIVLGVLGAAAGVK